jgi:hypothetical protein
MNQYPYIVLSKNVNEIFDGTYYNSLSREIELPHKPTNINYEKNFIVSIANIIGIVTFPMLLIGSIPSLIQNEGNMQDLALPLFIINSIFIISWISNSKKTKEIDNKNAINRKFYNEQLKIIKEINNANRIFTSKLSMLNDEEINKQCIIKYYKTNTISPQKIEHEYKEGKSEKLLFNILKELFNEKILTNHSIFFEDVNKRTYMPDIVYYNTSTGICIDIEIDEKFASDTGELIHTIKGNTERDDFFKNKYWHVLRFAEDQILNNLDSCVCLINSFLNKYDPEYWQKPLEVKGIKFNELTTFKTIERW